MAHGPAGHLFVLFERATTTNATATPTVVTATANVPSPSASAGTNASASPTVVTATASVVAPSLSEGATVTATVVTATAGVPTPTAFTFSGVYPASVSGRKLLDQHGNAIALKVFSSWAWPQNGSNAEITAHLEAVEALGFNAVTMWPCGGYYGGDWERWENQAGDPMFTGTPLASSLGSGWASMDWAMAEASRLGLTVLFSLYTGYNMPPRQGIGDQLIAVTNTNAYDYGVAVATRYAAFENIVWHYGADEDFDWGATLATRVDNLFHGLTDGDITAGRTRLIVAEPTNGRTGYDQFISQEGNGTTGYGWLNLSVNSVYNGGGTAGDINSVEGFDAVYTEVGATSLPVWDCEEPYVDAGTFDFDSGDSGQQHRERSLSTIIRGGSGFHFGHAAGWGVKALTNYTTTVDDWTDVYTNTIVLGMEHVNDMVDLIQGTDWAPNDSFVTTGIGSGDTKAAAGTDGSIAVAYFPSNRTTVVDTTILTGSGNVRLRWWNPQDGTYTSIATSEAQNASRSVTIPAAHGDGTRDWLLFVELLGDVTATPTVVTATAAVVAPTLSEGATATPTVVTATAGVPTPTVGAGVTVTATVVTATASAPAPSVAAGGSVSATPSVVTAVAAVVAPTVTATTNVTATPTVITATCSVVAPAVSAAGNTTATPTVVTATASVVAPTVTMSTTVTATVITAAAQVLTATAYIGITWPIITGALTVADLTVARTATDLTDARTMEEA